MYVLLVPFLMHTYLISRVCIHIHSFYFNPNPNKPMQPVDSSNDDRTNIKGIGGLTTVVAKRPLVTLQQLQGSRAQMRVSVKRTTISCVLHISGHHRREPRKHMKKRHNKLHLQFATKNTKRTCGRSSGRMRPKCYLIWFHAKCPWPCNGGQGRWSKMFKDVKDINWG